MLLWPLAFDACAIHFNHLAAPASVCCLQDTSRSFLCGAVADRSKYELFMKATMLDQVQANLHVAQGRLDQMKQAAKDIDADHG
jgi:hypothetical protein